MQTVYSGGVCMFGLLSITLLTRFQSLIRLAKEPY